MRSRRLLTDYLVDALVRQVNAAVADTVRSIVDEAVASIIAEDHARAERERDTIVGKLNGIAAPGQELLCMKQVAQICGCSVSTVKRWVSDGRLSKPVRIGVRAVRFRVEDVVEFLDKEGTR